jgi:aminoglycoside phosphotransferase (APT) family kinase protein
MDWTKRSDGVRPDWHALYLDLCDQQSIASEGYYHRNFAVHLTDMDVIVRIPIPDAEMVDLRIWPEPEILASIGPFVGNAPRLVHESRNPSFQVHTFIPGTILGELAPAGTPLPAHVLDDIVSLFVALTRIPRASLPALPGSWPADGDSSGFARLVVSYTEDMYQRFHPRYAFLYEMLGVPTDPLGPIRESVVSLEDRPFSFLHTDVHRKNMIVRDEVTTFLDWELALWGDPVYEMAIHLHKAAYAPTGESEIIAAWHTRMPARSKVGYERDLELYRAHERVKSVIGDTVRYSVRISAKCSRPVEQDLIDRLTKKLAMARPHWGMSEEVDRNVVEHVLRYWAEEYADTGSVQTHTPPTS